MMSPVIKQIYRGCYVHQRQVSTTPFANVERCILTSEKDPEIIVYISLCYVNAQLSIGLCKVNKA